MVQRAQMCPMHADEHVQPVYVLNETMDYLYTCTRVDGHGLPGPYSWPWSAAPAPVVSKPLGFDLDEALIEAVRQASHEHGGGWVEYGLVERAYALADPEQWCALLAQYDHTEYQKEGATRADQPYTASKRLGQKLGILRRRGDISFQQGPGTGRWKYNNPSSFYARLAVADSASICTWADSGCDMSDYMPAERPTA